MHLQAPDKLQQQARGASSRGALTRLGGLCNPKDGPGGPDRAPSLEACDAHTLLPSTLRDKNNQAGVEQGVLAGSRQAPAAGKGWVKSEGADKAGLGGLGATSEARANSNLSVHSTQPGRWGILILSTSVSL